MIIEYTLFGLHPHKINLLKADLEYLKADVQFQFAEKLIKIRQDRGLAHKIAMTISKRIPGMNLTLDMLITRIEIMNQLELIDYDMVQLDASTVKVTLKISNYLDMMSGMNIPLISHFQSSKKLVEHFEKSVKEVYSKNYTFKVIEENPQ